MKEQILDKLFNNRELTSEELVFIGSNLQDNAASLPPKFDHDNKMSHEACGITEKDADKLNKLLVKAVREGKLERVSEIVEKTEQFALKSPINLRLICMQCVKHAIEKRSDPLQVLQGLLGALRPPPPPLQDDGDDEE